MNKNPHKLPPMLYAPHGNSISVGRALKAAVRLLEDIPMEFTQAAYDETLAVIESLELMLENIDSENRNIT